MRALAVRGSEAEQSICLLDEMYRLRARVFGDRLGWDVRIENGRECDPFDTLGPIYILTLTPKGEVVGSARLLPATGPTMVVDTFPQLLGRDGLRVHDALIESSRFCVDTNFAVGATSGSFHLATSTMFAAIIEWSMVNGYDEIVTATDVRFERLLKRAGWPMERLGEPCLIGKTMSLAGILPADRESFAKVAPPGYQSSISSPKRVAA